MKVRKLHVVDVHNNMIDMHVADVIRSVNVTITSTTEQAHKKKKHSLQYEILRSRR